MPIEVKSGKHYRSHATLDNLIGKAEYGIPRAIVLSNANHGRDGKVEYLPIYLTMYMRRDNLPEDMIYELPV